MLQVADAAAGDHRNAHGICHRAGQRQVEADLGAVAVHAGEQDLSGAEAFHLARPLDGVKARILAPAMGEYLPASGRSLLGIHGDHDALCADPRRGIGHQLRIVDGRGVHADLVGTRVQQAAHVVHLAHAATDGERDEDLRGDGLDDVQDDVAVVGTGRDVEESDLVGALVIVAFGDLHRITGIAQFDEIDALDHAAGVDVETGNDAFGEHGRGQGLESLSASAWAFLKSSVPS
jgi:hypothetical protein